MKDLAVEKRYISVSEFCQIYGVGRTFAYRLIGNEGSRRFLESTKLGKRRLISVDSAEALMREGGL